METITNVNLTDQWKHDRGRRAENYKEPVARENLIKLHSLWGLTNLTYTRDILYMIYVDEILFVRWPLIYGDVIMYDIKIRKKLRSFSLTSHEVPTFPPRLFSDIFDVLDRAGKNIPRAKILERYGIWWLNYWEFKCQILAWLTRGRKKHVGQKNIGPNKAEFSGL